MTIPPPIVLIPHQAELEGQISSLPRAPGLYCLFGFDGPPHLGFSSDLRRRLQRLLLAPATGESDGKARLRGRLARVDCWTAGSRLESSLLMFAISKTLFPEDYLKRLRLRMPWFLGLLNRDRFPRLVLVNRIPDGIDLLLGPFATRDLAQYYEQEVLGLFQLRRCTEVLEPSSTHPGCIYGEMNQCLRPCQSVVSIQEYATEAARVSEFLSNNGKSTVAALSVARERASANLEFEQAAQLHKRLERVKASIAARDDVITNVYEMNGIAVTRSTRAHEIRLWPMRNGYWQRSLSLNLADPRPSAKSLDRELRELLSQSESENQAGGRLEHLAIFSRWYRSSLRDGEWFPSGSIRDLNYGKLVRQISKLAAGEAPVMPA